MESKVIVTLGNGFGKSATLYYTGDEFIFYVKPKWPSIFFGLLGSILANEREKYSFHTKNIKSAKISANFSSTHPVYEIYLTDGKKYTIEFKQNDNLAKTLNNIVKGLENK